MCEFYLFLALLTLVLLIHFLYTSFKGGLLQSLPRFFDIIIKRPILLWLLPMYRHGKGDNNGSPFTIDTKAYHLSSFKRALEILEIFTLRLVSTQKFWKMQNSVTLGVMYVKVYISRMKMSQRIQFWHQNLLKIMIFKKMALLPDIRKFSHLKLNINW